MKLTIAAITLAASTFAASADNYDFAYAESIAQQAPAIEACIADTLESLTPYYGSEMIGEQTYGEKHAENWMNVTTRGTEIDILKGVSKSALYDRVMAGDITAAAATHERGALGNGLRAVMGALYILGGKLVVHSQGRVCA